MRMRAAGSAQRSSVRATGNHGIGSRILRTLGRSSSFQGSGASSVETAERTKGNLKRLGVAAPLGVMMVLAVAPSAMAGKMTDRFFPLATGSGSLGGQFNSPRDVAVSQSGAGAADSGDVYVADTGNHRVQRFSADGTFERAWGVNVVGRNEVQAIQIANASSGSYTLTFDGATTGAIAYNATASTVQTALRGLSSINGAHVNVSGATGNNTLRTRTVTFVGDLAGTDVSEITATPSLSAGATLEVETLEDGAGGPGADFEICTDAALCNTGVATGGNAGNNLRNGAMSSPQGIAINQSTGDVYVRDRGNRRVNQYDADGNFIRSWGWDVIQPGEPGEVTNPVNERQTITLNDILGGGVTGGEFTLSFGAVAPTTTPGIAWNASAQDVESALEGLGGIGAGNVEVTGGGGGPGPWTVEFVGALAGTNVASITGDGSGLEGTGFFQTVGVATDAEGNPSAPGFEVCDAPSACQAGTAGSNGGQFSSSSVNGTGIAIAPATAPTAGNLFVVDTGGSGDGKRIMEFTATGSFVRAWGRQSTSPGFQICTTACVAAPSNTQGTADRSTFATSHPAHLAVDGAGIVYASDHISTAPADPHQNLVRRFDSSAGTAAGLVLDPILSTAGDGPLINAATNAMKVGPSGDTLLVARGDIAIQELDVSGGGAVEVDRHMEDSGLTANGLDLHGASGDLSVSSSSGSAHRVYVLDDDGAGTPNATIGDPFDVGPESASLSGVVNPDGFPSSYRFEYSKTGQDNDWTAAAPDVNIGSGTDDIEVGPVTVTGLDPNTFYRVRVVVTKGFGAGTGFSAEKVLLTDAVPPTAATQPVESVDTGRAHLLGTVNPRGSQTTYWFEWGPTAAYGNVAPVPAASAGSSNGPQVVTQLLDGLDADTRYHYRVCAINQQTATPICGIDRDFVTLRSSDTDGPPRAYELVSPADKIGGVGVGGWYNGPGTLADAGVAAHAGERFISRGILGSVLVDGGMTWGHDLALGGRTPSGWVTTPAFTLPAQGDPSYRMIGTLTATADLGRYAVQSNSGQLKMFPEMADWQTTNPSFVGGWDGRWEIIGPTAEAQAVSVPGYANRLTLMPAISADGSRLLGVGPIRGMLGSQDPTQDQAAGRSLYLNELSSPLSNAFPALEDPVGRRVVHVCTGTAGIDRTTIPASDGGNLAALDCPEGVAGREGLISSRGASVETRARNPMSADGSRVFFMSPDDDRQASGAPAAGCAGTGATSSCPPQLYVRQERADGSVVTRWISRAVDGLLGTQDASLTGPAIFEGATPDGGRVFFRTNSPLTPDDPNGGCGAPCLTGAPSNSSWDLYMYELPSDPSADPDDGELTRITRGPTGDADPNGLQGGGVNGESQLLRFLSDSGDRLYFATSAALSGVTATANGTVTVPGGTPTTTAAVNLYYHETDGSGSWRFVTQLPRATADSLSECASTGVNQRTPVEPDGISGNVQSTDNTNCVRGKADGSFVTFWTDGRLTADDPDSSSGDIYGYDAVRDQLVRVTRPQGGDAAPYTCDTVPSSPTLGAQCYGDGGYAASLLPTLGVATEPEVEGDRIAFFQSRARLLPADTDSAFDTYEWRNGELSLLTGGASETDGALYVGNDASGRNVYFATRDRYSWQDHDAVGDVYTAREGGGIPQPAPAPICGVFAGACQGGGAGHLGVDVNSTSAGGGDASPGERARLVVAAPGRRVRRVAARRGVLVLRVKGSQPGRVRGVARSRRNGRAVSVGRGSVRARAGRQARLRLKLNRPARRLLRSGRALRLTIYVSQPGAHTRTLSVQLRRPAR
jgi:hypothetical protein